MAINHTCATTDDLIYLIRHDTTHGLLKDDINIKQLSEDAISLNGRVVTLLSTRDIAQLDWHKLGVDYVLECTGKFTKVDQAVRHITEAKCKRVVISAPSADAPTFVYGVNSEGYHDSAANHVISAASCTTNCVTPILKALNDSLGVSQAFLTTVHAATQSQNILDGYSKKNRRLGNSSVPVQIMYNPLTTVNFRAERLQQYHTYNHRSIQGCIRRDPRASRKSQGYIHKGAHVRTLHPNQCCALKERKETLLTGATLKIQIGRFDGRSYCKHKQTVLAIRSSGDFRPGIKWTDGGSAECE